MDPRILEKIKKCLNLSKSDNEHEAAAALRQAQKLMAAHNLSATDVEVGPLEQGYVKSKASASLQKNWESVLFHGIKDAFGLLLTFTRGYPYAHYSFVGPKDDVVIALHTANVLHRKLVKARLDFLNKKKDEIIWSRGPAVANTKAIKKYLTDAADSYACGWGLAVTAKVDKMYRSDVAKARILEFQQELTQGRKAKSREQDIHGAALHAGKEDAAAVELRRAMNEANRAKALEATS